MIVTAVSCGALLLLWYRIRSHLNVDMAKEDTRQNVTLAEPSIYILKLLRSLEYIWNGPEILRKAHMKDMPYAIATPETYQVHFSSTTHIKQLLHMPDTHLSLHALAKDMFQPSYTMNGLAVHDCMSANGSIHQRALQAELRAHLPALSQPLSACISKTLTTEITPKPLADGWRAFQIFPFAKRLITNTNALIFFGPKVSSDPIFLKAALEYPEHVMQTAEVLRLIPAWLAPFIAPRIMRGHRAVTILIGYLTPVVESRLRLADNQPPEQADCIQFIVNAVVHKKQRDEWPAERIVQVLLGIWFASVHQPAMCLFYALDDLCRHPQYIQPLRDELSLSQAMMKPSSYPESDSIIDTDTTPLLDAFLRESARLNPTDSISMRRKVLRPTTFSDGTRLARDDIACIPLQMILQSEVNYIDPLTFNPGRFVHCTASGTCSSNKNSKFTDADVTFPIWGLGKHACPGRHYASVLLKLVLAHVLLRYDVRLPDGDTGTRSFYWRSSIVPRSGAVLYFRERKFGMQ
ncbi:hypothetical protein BDV06DRAFT_233927 [Aspergillus oleicola]